MMRRRNRHSPIASVDVSGSFFFFFLIEMKSEKEPRDRGRGGGRMSFSGNFWIMIVIDLPRRNKRGE